MIKRLQHSRRYFTSLNPNKTFDFENSTPDDLTKAVDDALRKCTKACDRVKSIGGSATWQNTAVPVIQINQLLHHTMRTVENSISLRGDSFQKVYDDNIIKIAQQLGSLAGSKEVCSALQRVLATMPFDAADIKDPEQLKQHRLLLSLAIQYNRNGGMLSEEMRSEFIKNRRESSIFSGLFEANMADANVLPEFREFEKIMTTSENRTERRELYNKFISRASSGDLDNQMHLHQILLLRKQRSELLGFTDYATLIFSKVAKRIENFNEAHRLLIPVAKSELETLKQISGFDDIYPWDMPYLMTQLESSLSFDNKISFKDLIEALTSICMKSFDAHFEINYCNQPMYDGELTCTATVTTANGIIKILSADMDHEMLQSCATEINLIISEEVAVSDKLSPFDIRQVANLFGEAFMSLRKADVEALGEAANRNSCLGSFLEFCVEDLFKIPKLYPANHAIRELALVMVDLQLHHSYDIEETVTSAVPFSLEILQKYSAIAPSPEDCSVCNSSNVLSGAASHVSLNNKFIAAELAKDPTKLIDINLLNYDNQIFSPEAFVNRMTSPSTC